MVLLHKNKIIVWHRVQSLNNFLRCLIKNAFTINALGGNIRMVNAGGYKVTALAPGADGRKVASVGTVKGVTKYAFVILISVNEDGTVETVEGTVDPVTLQVMGAFKGTPKTITVSVVMAAKK